MAQTMRNNWILNVVLFTFCIIALMGQSDAKPTTPKTKTKTVTKTVTRRVIRKPTPPKIIVKSPVRVIVQPPP